MKIEVRTRNPESGEIIFEGSLNAREISFLLQYGIQDLLAAGYTFMLQEPDEPEDSAMRIQHPNIN